MAVNDKPLRVAIVGACAAGKSSLVSALRDEGYEARHVAQEHSYVPNMWQRISDPDILIYLDVDLESIKQRRTTLDFRREHLEEQNRRLAHARANCSLYLDTSDVALEEVRRQVLDYLANWRDKKQAA